MVCSGADDSNIDTISLIPSSKAINNIDSVSGVQIVDSAFPVDLPDLWRQTSASSEETKHVTAGWAQISDNG